MIEDQLVSPTDTPRLDRARRAFNALRPCLAMASIPRSVREEIIKELGISSATFYRYLEALRARPVASTLLRANPGPGTYASRNPSQSLLIEQCIERTYLTQQKRSVRSAYRQLTKLCVDEGVDVPSYSTFRRKIELVNKKKRIWSRIGARAYASEHSQKTTIFSAERPLEVVQVDHTKVDLLIVDSASGEEIGRPWITVLVDVHTRLVMSFHLSLEAPSCRSVAEALTRAVYGYEEFLNKHALSTTWPRLGQPRKLHMDNAKEFRSRAMRYGAGEHGIDLYYRPPGQPHYGGHVESLIGTLMTKVHELPGTTFSNVQQKGNYNSSKHAVFTLWDLNKFIAHYICEDYHRSVHSSLGTTPLRMLELAREADFSPSPPVKHRDAFRADFMLRYKRKIQRSGIYFKNICYADPIISDWDAANVVHVHVIPRANDVSKIDVFGPDKKIRTISARDPKTPAISWGEYNRLRKNVIARAKSHALTHAQIACLVQVEHDIMADAQERKKRQRRSEEARRQAAGDEPKKKTRRISVKRKPGQRVISTDRLMPARKLGDHQDD